MKFTKILTILILALCIVIVCVISFGLPFLKKEKALKMGEINVTTENNDQGQTETDEFYYSTNGRRNIEITKSATKLLDLFNSEKLAENALGCSGDQKKEYFDELLNKFSNNDILYTYSFKYKNIPDGEWIINIAPNKLGYKNIEEFKKDFDLCEAGAKMYPSLVSEKYLLFISSCGSGVDSPESRICDELQVILKDTIQLK